jgi:hypothetical protein
MKESELSSKVKQKLSEFDTIGSIQPSEAWNQSLMHRLAASRQSSNSDLASVRFLIVVLLLVLINIGFILNTVIRKSNQTSLRDDDLQTISEQLLINPPSANY